MLMRLKKADYSEWVVRNALYWLSPTSSWILEEEKEAWLVQLEFNSFEVSAELNRLLNDYVLREQIMAKTQHIRESIAGEVLKAVNARLSKEC